jgi:hypothetical protein
MAVIPLRRHQFPVPSQQRVRCDQGFKLVQHFAPECLRLSGESTAFAISETNAASTVGVIAGGNNYFGNRNCTSSSKVHLEASVGAATL